MDAYAYAYACDGDGDGDGDGHSCWWDAYAWDTYAGETAWLGEYKIGLHHKPLIITLVLCARIIFWNRGCGLTYK